MKTIQQTLIISTLLLFMGCGDDIKITSSVTAPVAKDDKASLASGASIQIDILSNDRASDGRTLDTSSVNITSDVKEGATVLANNGTVTYTSDGVFVGSETFTYTVKDTNSTTSNKATVTITISETTTSPTEEIVNTAPTAVNDTATTSTGVQISIDVLNNDVNNGGGLADISIVRDSNNGVSIANNNGTVTYIPNSAFTGVDTFTYQVQDDDGLVSNTATVTITVS